MNLKLCYTFAVLLVGSCFAAAGPATRYDVTLTVDLKKHLIQGREEIALSHDPGVLEWQKQPGLRVERFTSSSADITPMETAVRAEIRSAGAHRMRFEYTVTPTRGLRWLPNGNGFYAAFYCEAWMVCFTAPEQLGSLRLEIVIVGSVGTAVGPGKLARTWRDRHGRHFVFEVPDPTQTYLFSFCVANMLPTSQGNLTLYSADGGHNRALEKTADAAVFMREKAGVDAIASGYVQAFAPQPGLAQEASGMALLSEPYLSRLEAEDDVVLMAHELAHQWWGVMVGIRSWSDFWLNEGMAQFMSIAYLERERGHMAYADRMQKLRIEMDEIRAKGLDRPLHFERWTDVRDALGTVPYVKGALFLDRLREEVGESAFWRGIALYTSRNAHQLVDSRDFQRALEESSGRDLSIAFQEVNGN